MIPQWLIAATNSGCGKTTFTIGLLRALRRRGLSVQPFKCGPDYIDARYHTRAAGLTSVNLDTWMASPDHIQYIYGKYGGSADACVAEGVMGLFDGFDKTRGSSSEVARTLGLPVVLVVNARSTAYSAAALIHGFAHFDPRVEVAGVVFNLVASASHAAYLREACADVGVPCLGCLPRLAELEVPSRHLGLTLDTNFQLEQWIDRVADTVEQHVDLDHLLSVCRRPTPPASESPQPMRPIGRVAVADDEAFAFVYRENIARLAQAGEVVRFSPMRDERLPEADLVYLPGGYPEFYLDALTANTPMRDAIRRYAERGGRILAECGGMMYLCRAVTGMDGVRREMVGILGQEATMEGMRLRLGYRRFELGGTDWRGHEFHYSSVVPSPDAPPSVAQQYNAKGDAVETPVYRHANVLASYTHLYWGESDISTLFG